VNGSAWGLPGIALCVVLLQALRIAQQPVAQPQCNAPSLGTPTPTQDPAPLEQNQKPDKNRPRGVSKNRLFYTLPNYLTVENFAQVPRLTTKQKFKVITKNSFDYMLIPWYGFLAGVSQAKNDEAGFGKAQQATQSVLVPLPPMAPLKTI